MSQTLLSIVKRLGSNQIFALAGGIATLAWHWIYRDYAGSQEDYMGFRVLIFIYCLMLVGVTLFSKRFGPRVIANMDRFILGLAFFYVGGEILWLLPHNPKSAAHPLGTINLIVMLMLALNSFKSKIALSIYCILLYSISPPEIWPVTKAFHINVLFSVLGLGLLFHFERHRLTEKIMDSNRIRSEIEKSAQSGGWVINLRDQTVWLTPGATELLSDHEPYEAIPISIFLAKCPNTFQSDINKLLSEASHSSIGKKHVREFLWRNTPARWLRVILEPHYTTSGKVGKLMGTLQDITEQVTHESQIQEKNLQILHASKMSALGEMAGGMAHEINNPMQIIMGTTESLLDALDRGNEPQVTLKQGLERIMKTGARIVRIIRGLRAFSRDSQKEPHTQVQLTSILHDTLDLCEERFKNFGVCVDLKLSPDLSPILCNPIQISQALLNLFNNAFDAIQKFPIEERWIKVELTQQGQEQILLISNGGPAIKAEVREKIFQPFFTTKEVGQGTGLGLSITQGILHSHHGTLTYEESSPHPQFKMTLKTA